MNYAQVFEISRSGMSADKLRLDVAAANLANMQTSAPNAASVYRPLRVLAQSAPIRFEQLLDSNQHSLAGGVLSTTVVPTTDPARRVYEPGHPHADPTGFVNYPAVSHSGEIINMLSALRSYEANVAAFNLVKTMAQRALDIGGQS